MTQLVWPNGTVDEPRVSDLYGPRAPIETDKGWTRPYHVGQDWYGIGELRAIGDGTVVESSWVGWAGWQVLIYLGIIDGSHAWVRYCHLAHESALSRGDTVARGDLIGVEGASGQVVGVHLHLEIYRGHVDRGSGGNPGSTIDPRAFIQEHLYAPPIEQDDIMAVYLRATGNSTPIDAKNPGSSRIWAGDNRDIGGARYSGVWERSEDGSIRRLFPGEWAAIQQAYTNAGRKIPYADISGNELEKMYLVSRAEPKK